MKVTEQMIAKTDLTNEEKKIIRFLYDLPSAGDKTEKWINNLGQKKYDSLRASAEEKLSNIVL